jgi:spermidine/putrescine transport system permease protein
VANRSPDAAQPAMAWAGSRFGRRVLTGVAAAIFAFLYLPVAVLVVYSFHEAKVFAFPPADLSFKWHVELFNDRDMLTSISNSLLVAACVIPVTLALGVPAAFALNPLRLSRQGGIRARRAAAADDPGPDHRPGDPADHQADGLQPVAGHRGDRAFGRLAAGGHHPGLCPPAPFRSPAGRGQHGPWRRPLADFPARDLPNISTAIIGSALLVFTLSFDEIAITFFLTGADNTLPMHIWSMLREGISPEIAAIATITVSASIAVMLVGLRLLRSEPQSD